MIQGLKQDLQVYLGVPKNIGQDELIFFCPFCKHHKRKLQVHLELGHWRCWTCTKKGRSFFTLFKSVNADKSILLKYGKKSDNKLISSTKTSIDANRSPITLPKEFKPLYHKNNDIQYKKALRYLFNRNITVEDILKYNIGYCDSGLYKNMIIIPSYDSNGILNYFVGRSYESESNYKHKNPKVSKNIIGFELFINWNLPVYLVEGSFDAISIKRNAIPLFGKRMQRFLKDTLILKKVKKVYVCLDADAKPDAMLIYNDLTKQGIECVIITFDGKDPNEIGFTKVQSVLQNDKSKTDFKDLIKLKLQL